MNDDLQHRRKMRRKFERHQAATTVGGFALMTFLVIAVNLALLAAAVFVVVKVLQWTGVLH